MIEMGEPSDARNPQHAQSRVVQDLVEAGKKAFDPSLDASLREDGIKEYNELVHQYVTRMNFH